MHQQANPFSDFFRAWDTFSVGGGVDHRGGPNPHHAYPGFPFAAQGPCRRRGGCRGRAGPHRGGPRRNQQPPQDPPRDPEKSADSEQAQDPPEVAPETESEQPPPYGRPGHHGHHGHHRHAQRPFPFDPAPFLSLFNNHPLAQNLRAWAEQAAAAAAAPDSDSDTFTPPLDLFESETEYVLHIALPGAKKEDIGVNWDSEAGQLRVAGVVHRPGDEEFLQGLRSAERRVGMFERSIKLPPGDNERKDEVDGEGIAAKMEDGVLVVRVPKVEKDEWTEVRKVDIE